MKIALASPPFPRGLDEGLTILEKLVIEAAEQHAEIICFIHHFTLVQPVLLLIQQAIALCMKYMKDPA